MADQQFEIVKVLLIGDSACGKSALIQRFAYEKFSEEFITTIGIDFAIKMMQPANNAIPRKLQIWDTAGQERFRTITSSYYRSCHVILMVYDVTNRESFDAIEKTWKDSIAKFADGNVIRVIVGCKKDLSAYRKVSTEEGEQLAAKHNLQFIEVSAKEEVDNNVDRLFQWITDVMATPADQRAQLSLAPSDSIFRKAMEIFWRNAAPLLKDHNGMKLYEPLIGINAPGLLKKEVQQWIQLNANFLAPKIVDLATAYSHYFCLDTKEITVDELVHLFMVSKAIQNHQLGNTVVDELIKKSKNENIDIQQKILETPRLVRDSDIDLSGATTYELADRLKEKMESSAENNLGPREGAETKWKNIMRELYDTREQSGDLTVQLGDQSYKAHKLIVAFTCDFFRGCLLSQFKEADTATLRIEADVTNTAWEALLQYLYTRDTAHISDPDDCLSILSVSSYFMMTNETNSSIDHARLLRHCEQTAYDSITDDTVFELLLSAHNSEDKQAKDITVKYILNNYVRLFEKYESEMSKLPKALMFGLMTRMWCSTSKTS